MADSKTTLTEVDARGLDALIAEVDRRVRTPGIYTSQEATEFVKRGVQSDRSDSPISKRCTIGFEERCLVVYRFDGTVVMRLTIEEQAKRGISIDDIYRAIGLRPKAVPARQSVGLVPMLRNPPIPDGEKI